MTRLGSFLERALPILWAEDSGVAAIEFAFIALALLTVVAGTVDLGLLVYTEEEIDSAIAAGAGYAAVNATSVNSTNGASLASAIATIVANANGSSWANSSVVVNNGPTASVSSGTLATGGTATNADSYYCPSGSPPSWSWGSSVTQGSPCASGGIGGKFVTITASRSFTPLFPTFGFVQNGTISQSALIETQ